MTKRSPGRRSSHLAGVAKPGALRCAIYTRVSTDQGLEQDFNSLDAQREACVAYVRSQAHEGWVLVPTPIRRRRVFRRQSRPLSGAILA